MAPSCCIAAASASPIEKAHILRHLQMWISNSTRHRTGLILRTVQVALQQLLYGSSFPYADSVRGAYTFQDLLPHLLTSIRTGQRASTTTLKVSAARDMHKVTTNGGDVRRCHRPFTQDRETAHCSSGGRSLNVRIDSAASSTLTMPITESTFHLSCCHSRSPRTQISDLRPLSVFGNTQPMSDVCIQPRGTAQGSNYRWMSIKINARRSARSRALFD